MNQKEFDQVYHSSYFENQLAEAKIIEFDNETALIAVRELIAILEEQGFTVFYHPKYQNSVTKHGFIIFPKKPSINTSPYEELEY